MQKLFLLDGMALVYRAFYAFQYAPRLTSTGLNTSAIFGFITTLNQILNKEKPTHLAVSFDTAAPTFRHIAYPLYKAQRQAMPDGIRDALPHIFNVLKAQNVPILIKEGFEADDIIGTFAKKAAAQTAQAIQVFMVTPDKDYGQLVDENIFMYKPSRKETGFETLGVPEILAQWEIEYPTQLIDILGLMGDASDNIPGVAGIGEKTAKTLIKKFGSIENLLQNTHQLTGKQKETIQLQAAQATLSKQLATIDINVDMPFDLDALQIATPNIDALTEIYQLLEFKTLLKNLQNPNANAPQAATAAPTAPTNQFDLFATATAQPAAQTPDQAPTTTHLQQYNPDTTQYIALTTHEAIQDFIRTLLTQKSVCFDTETDGLDTLTCQLVGLSFAYQPHQAYYIPTPDDFEATQAIVDILKPFFENETIEKIGQNLKFDIEVLQKYSITVQGKLFDTMLAHYLLQPDQRHSMDNLARVYLNYQTIEITELIGKKGKNQLNMRTVPLAKITEYACEDADITLQLKLIFEKEITHQNLQHLFENVEIQLLRVLVDMETEGVALDKMALQEFSKTLETDIIIIEKEIYDLAGTHFNIASPKQIGEVFFDLLKLDAKPSKTATGQYKTDEEVLQNLAPKHPIAQKVLDFRGLQKLKSTYVDALPELISPSTGRVHTSFNQTVAATGRLSSNNPNLQNIPIRTQQGREVRRAFVPRNADNVIVSADYSQIELRIMAHFSHETAMITAFEQGIDIHTATAAKVFKIDAINVDADQRRKAKMVNFGIIYGISAFGLAQRLAVPRSEASDLIKEYFAIYPNIKVFMDTQINAARENGYVETILGRRRYLPDINNRNVALRQHAERNAINAPIQGSAADLIKLAMIAVQTALKTQQLHSKMTLQVHDELVFDAVRTEVPALKTLIHHSMTTALRLDVPLEIEIGTGDSWLEAH
jgi:DNA polymerase-1